MGEIELKIALQQEGEARIRDFWAKAEEIVAKRRVEINQEIEHLRNDTDQRLQAKMAELRNNLLFEAQSRARARRLHAEAALEKRLLEQAKDIVAELADSTRTSTWASLRNEMPAIEWAVITVHPKDYKLAKESFPQATINCDESVICGLIAANIDGSIRVDNSLSCRLKRAWPDVLPKIIDALRKKVNCDEAARTNATG